MKAERKEKLICPSLIIAVIVIILGVVGMYMSFSMAYSDFAARAEDGAVITWELKNIKDMLTGLFWQLSGSGLMVIIGVSVILIKLVGYSKKNDEIKEKLELLEEEKNATEELIEKSREMEHIERLETIGTMTSGIAHEFNNMLTPIMGYSIMSMDMVPSESEELMDNLTEIYDASTRAKSLISRLSELSKKESRSDFRLLSPDELLIKTEEMSHVSFPSNVTLEKDYNCPDACIMGDETQLRQVALNLVINAVQAMKETGGKITISTRRDGDKVKIVFADNGPGISQENLGKIFNPFFTTKETGQGTGLGLAIVQHIVNEHGGTIAVKSKQGEGATFTITLPVAA